MGSQQISQAQQSVDGDARVGLLRKLTASHWIEHPAGYGDLETLR